MDLMKLYDIVYALTVLNGREKALFGDHAVIAREAFSRSLASSAFPELWFEIPLIGEPWLDFHALTAYADVAGTDARFSGQGGPYADALSWFAAQRKGTVRQMALSYDTSANDVENPAVQLLVNGRDIAIPLGFLEAAGRSDLRDAYATFIAHMLPEWYACYVGVFPGRASSDKWVRVECIVGDDCQRAYADDVQAISEHLSRVGISDLGVDALRGIQKLAQSPFPLELQFNVGLDGRALPVVSASVRFAPTDWTSPEQQMPIFEIARWLQGENLADQRCLLLPDTAFAKRVSHEGNHAQASCFPAFVKVRYRKDEKPVAKSYLLAQVNKIDGDEV